MLVIQSKTTDYNTKIGQIGDKIDIDHDHDKYITTKEFNQLTSKHFTARLKQTNLATKSDIANSVKKTDFDDKLKRCFVTSNKNELDELSKRIKANSKNRLIKDQIHTFNIVNGEKHFSLGIFQNYLVFIVAKRYSKYFRGTTRINLSKSNGISEENIENISK